MKPSKRDNILYLEDIVLAIERIQEYIHGLSLDQFIQDHKTADAVVRNFEIIGEASKNISVTIKDNHPDVPWEEMYRLRNRISHEYFGIEFDIIWDIIANELPKNLSDLKLILESERGKTE